MGSSPRRGVPSPPRTSALRMRTLTACCLLPSAVPRARVQRADGAGAACPSATTLCARATAKHCSAVARRASTALCRAALRSAAQQHGRSLPSLVPSTLLPPKTRCPAGRRRLPARGARGARRVCNRHGGLRRTLVADERARDLDLLAADNSHVLARQELLGDGGRLRTTTVR